MDQDDSLEELLKLYINNIGFILANLHGLLKYDLVPVQLRSGSVKPIISNFLQI